MTYNVTTAQLSLIIVLVLWELVWKGLAMWRAAQRKQKYWFGALLVINTVGILPILYLLSTEMHDETEDTAYLKTPLAHR